MIDLQRKVIILDKITPIISFGVWWNTPRGLTKDLEEALKVCKELELDSISLVAVPVAIGEGVYEILR